jgi:DNA-binding protein YbaB
MTSPQAEYIAREMEAALATLATEQRKLAAFQEQVGRTTTVVHSKDRMLTMTFNGRGELDKLTLNDSRYREMAPVELAKIFMETLAAGRREAVQKLGGLMGSDPLPGVSFTDLASGQIDLMEVVNSLVGPALGQLPPNLFRPAEIELLRGES